MLLRHQRQLARPLSAWCGPLRERHQGREVRSVALEPPRPLQKVGKAEELPIQGGIGKERGQAHDRAHLEGYALAVGQAQHIVEEFVLLVP